MINIDNRTKSTKKQIKKFVLLSKVKYYIKIFILFRNTEINDIFENSI